MIENLFVKAASNHSATTSVNRLSGTTIGIVGGVPTSQFRHLLILPKSTLTEFGIAPGQLGENVVINAPFNIHSLESGTVIALGSLRIRLTFLCEPCRKIKDIVNVKSILYKRGYLAQVVQAGHARLGDKVKILDQKYEQIPYEVPERIKWYLSKCESSVSVSRLVTDIGLSKSYCRAIPNIIKRHTDIDKSRIHYGTQRTGESAQISIFEGI